METTAWSISCSISVKNTHGQQSIASAELAQKTHFHWQYPENGAIFLIYSRGEVSN